MTGARNTQHRNWSGNLSSCLRCLMYRNPRVHSSSSSRYLSSCCNPRFSNSPPVSRSSGRILSEQARHVTQCLVFDSIVIHNVRSPCTSSKGQPIVTMRYADLCILFSVSLTENIRVLPYSKDKRLFWGITKLRRWSRVLK